MENQTFYLLCALIERQEGASTGHQLFKDKNEAIKAMDDEIKSCAENFNFDESKFDKSFGNHYEWRNQDGYGFEVWIEEIEPK